MPINPEAVGSKGEPIEVSWDSKDCLLYAVGIGAGTDELAFTTENTSGVEQLVFPTFPVVIGWGAGSAMANIGEFNWAMLVHGQQSVTLHQPIPVEGTATLQSEIVAIYDKGKAAVVVSETTATLGGAPLYTTTSSAFIRGEGGWGGDRGPSGPQNVPPDRAPDHQVTYQTSPDQALVVPAVGRPQPAAQRPGVRRDGWLRPADPARPVHVRLHRPGAAAHAVRQRPGAVRARRGPVRLAGVPGEALTVSMWEVDGGDACSPRRPVTALVIDQGLLRRN